MKITGYIFEDEGTVKNYISDIILPPPPPMNKEAYKRKDERATQLSKSPPHRETIRINRFNCL